MLYFAITQRVVSKHHHSLKCRKLRLLHKGHSLKRICYFKYVFIFKRRTVLIGPYRQLVEPKRGLYYGEVLSLSVDEVDRQIFPVLNHRRFNLHCHAIDVLK